MTTEELNEYALKLYPVKNEFAFDDRNKVNCIVDVNEPLRKAYVRGRIDTVEIAESRRTRLHNNWRKMNRGIMQQLTRTAIEQDEDFKPLMPYLESMEMDMDGREIELKFYFPKDEVELEIGIVIEVKDNTITEEQLMDIIMQIMKFTNPYYPTLLEKKQKGELTIEYLLNKWDIKLERK